MTELAHATVGGGCFWCLDPLFRDLKGVTDVVVGYAGGHVPNPSYEQVCGKATGHAEVVQVTFDPAVVSYADLIRLFLTVHDPTTKDQQGADVGPQYRSIIVTVRLRRLPKPFARSLLIRPIKASREKSPS